MAKNRPGQDEWGREGGRERNGNVMPILQNDGKVAITRIFL